MRTILILFCLTFTSEIACRKQNNQDISPYIKYGPHGYKTFFHSKCQKVTTAETKIDKIKGKWFLIEYINSHDGKPTGSHAPYLCPEARMIFESGSEDGKVNISQLSYEWPALYLDKVEWKQDEKESGVFFHEENIFSYWTLKVMHLNDHSMVFFLCIDYTIWPGWNHRGIYTLSRSPKLKGEVDRQISINARKKMRMTFDRQVNTTTCDPDEWQSSASLRWHPHKNINRSLYRAVIHPYMSRNHRRKLD